MNQKHYVLDEFNEDQYKQLAAECPKLIAFTIGDLRDELLFAVPMDVGRVTNILDLIEGTLERYGDTESVFDFQAMAVVRGVPEKIKENLVKHAKHPEQSLIRILEDLDRVLRKISSRITEMLESIESPILDEIGSAYRFSRLEKGQVLLRLLSFNEIMKLSGREKRNA